MKTQVFRVLALGDTVGEESCEKLRRLLPAFRTREGIDLVIANGENSSRRGGIDRVSAEMLYAAGVDLITTGNHVFRQREIYDFLDGAETLLRPCNYPDACPGKGYSILQVSGYRILVVNVMGTLFMEALRDPFDTVERLLERLAGQYDFALCDIHAEATGEKVAFGRLFADRFAAVFGTHTHVQTSDARVLPGGCGYITDLGMCASSDSVLGMKTEIALEKWRKKMPVRYEVATGSFCMQGAIFEIDPAEGRCLSARAVEEK